LVELFVNEQGDVRRGEQKQVRRAGRARERARVQSKREGALVRELALIKRKVACMRSRV
jgi:hypothetical protein